tara:strand:+ start:948 stop:1121 length:174 start_codon:yes stop_codon:yes gene_type:complete
MAKKKKETKKAAGARASKAGRAVPAASKAVARKDARKTKRKPKARTVKSGGSPGRRP